jgi:formylglycine-generating enzyme required for sulfatase activity
MYLSKNNFRFKFLVIFVLLWTFSLRVASQTNITSIVDEKNVEMVLVPAGEFEAGASLEDAVAFCSTVYLEEYGCDIEVFGEFQLVHERQFVSVDAFYMDRYEVSLASYLDCVRVDVCTRESIEDIYEAAMTVPNFPTDIPVSGINYYEAAVYCAWREGRLPTENEWEYAAVGTTGNPFPWGESTENIPANYCDRNCPIRPDVRGNDGYESFAPVSAFEEGQSWAGIFNLSGNVSEWTSSRQLGTDGILYDVRIVKGGNYISPINGLAVWMRLTNESLVSRENGFRCVKTA